MLSIVIPMYNVAQYIEHCLDSIVQQPRFKDIDVIIVNDGSTDDSLQRIEPYVSTFENVKILHKPNGGLGSARNFGLRHCAGEFVFFLDADDWIADNAIERLLNIIETTPVDIIKFNHCRVTPEGFKTLERATVPANFTNVLSGASPSSACFQVFRTDLFLQNNLFFDESIFYEDVALIFKIYHKAKIILNISDVIYFYLYRYGSITASYSDKKLNDLFFGYEIAVDYVKQHGLIEIHQDDLCLRLVRLMVYAVKKIFNTPNCADDIKKIIDKFSEHYVIDDVLLKLAKIDIKVASDFYRFVSNGYYNYLSNIHQRGQLCQDFVYMNNFRLSENINELCNYFRGVAALHERYAIYGDGLIAKLVKTVTDKPPVAIIDRAFQCSETRENVLHCTLSDASSLDVDVILVTTLGREHDIQQQLQQLGVPAEKIKVFQSEFLFF